MFYVYIYVEALWSYKLQNVYRYLFCCYNLVIFFYFQAGEQKTEYRAWNPFRSKLAAAILGGVDKIHMGPGKKVLYLGAASGTTVSHVSDIVGPVSS